MKKVLVLSLMFVLLTMSLSFAAEEKGSLVMVGGALRADNDAVYEEFIRLAGGAENAKIGIIPLASGSPHKYTQLFIEDMTVRGLSESQVELIPIAVKDDGRTEDIDESSWAANAYDTELAEKVKGYTGIWFVGGDQTRITKTLLMENGDKTPVLESIWSVYNSGGVIGGTSAGAAIMSEIMIAGGDSFGALSVGHTENYDDSTLDYQNQGGLVINDGLGFFKEGIIDQHFDRKGRLGRLIVTGYDHKDMYPISFGIEENTALVYETDTNKLSVKGENGVVVVDLRRTSKVDESYKDIMIGYLESTDVYDLNDNAFIMDESKYTTIGYEYFYRENPVITGSVDADSTLKTTIAYNLIDNEAVNEVSTYLFDTSGTGFEFRFFKNELTEGYWGQSGAADLYSFENVGLDIRPVTVSISSDTQMTVQVAQEKYIVKKGDVLWKIAEKFNTSVKDIANLNELSDTNYIIPGQEILLP